MGCGPSIPATKNIPDTPNASTTSPPTNQLATAFLNERVTELGIDLSLEVDERDRLQNQRNDLAGQFPTYVSKPSKVPIDIWNEVEDKRCMEKLDELMARFDGEVGPHIQGGKDREAVLRVLEEKRAEIRDVRKEIGRLKSEIDLYEQQVGV